MGKRDSRVVLDLDIPCNVLDTRKELVGSSWSPNLCTKDNADIQDRMVVYCRPNLYK